MICNSSTADMPTSSAPTRAGSASSAKPPPSAHPPSPRTPSPQPSPLSPPSPPPPSSPLPPSSSSSPSSHLSSPLPPSPPSLSPPSSLSASPAKSAEPDPPPNPLPLSSNATPALSAPPPLPVPILSNIPLTPSTPLSAASPLSPLSPFSPNSAPLGSDEASVARPSLYVHAPIARPAPIEKYYGYVPTAHLELLDELKSDRLEGIYNLSFLLLAFALLYLIIRNVVETGFLIRPTAVCRHRLIRDFGLLCSFLIPLPFLILFPFKLISAHARRTISSRRVIRIYSVFLLLVFAIATSILFHLALNPLCSLVAAICLVIMALKMHSFVFTNILLAEETASRRRARRRSKRRHRTRQVDITNDASASVSSREGTAGSNANTDVDNPAIVYPRNVTLRNLAYFIVAPTLVYETGYPRTDCIRAGYVASYALQAVMCGVLQYILVMQFCIPVWRTSEAGEKLWFLLLKLALPSFFMWLLMFWGFFHCMLNAIAELTRFADRQFYREWWNSTTLHQFWRWWNIPVHEWCIRHLYVESVERHHVNARTAALGTFIMSAIMHEYVCFVAFGMLRPYMFTGMLAQAPLMELSNSLRGSRKGNMFMWLMLFIGQSCMVLFYVRDYLITYGTLICGP